MSEKLTVIDGVKYREVSRKANVGELVLFKNAEATFGDYENGDVWTVGRRDPSGVYKTKGEIWPYADDSEYVVLEPLSTEVEPDDLRAQVDGLTQTVASLTLRVTELERSQSGKLTPQVIDDFVQKVRESSVQVPPAPREKTRDEIVEIAKKDVAELACAKRYNVPICHRQGDTAIYDPEGRDYVEFVVNREKRTVVALIYNTMFRTEVWARGKSRCAPDDCFNVHIGKAIAVRRALGLTVPNEYYEAPQPTGVCVGDIIRWDDSTRYEFRITTINGDKFGFYFLGGDKDIRFNNGERDLGEWSYTEGIAKYCTVIDDSREEVSV